ncbi:MAG: hypothetical protein AAF467_25765, partial [Actinomycetota bacterium]
MTLTTYRIDRDGADRLLFLMHGYSAEQHHLASYVPLIDPDERFTAIAPRAPIDLPEGDGAAWWTMNPQTRSRDVGQFTAAVAMVEALIAGEADKAGVPLERCVVGGFSQGGYLSLALAGAPDAPRYAGVWAMCCGIPDIEGVEVDLSQGGGRPALFQWGTRDAIIGTDQPKEVVAALRNGGWDARDHAY